MQRTNINGVYAAGDVHDHVFRQAITAAGAGAAAAIAAEKFVAELENRAYPGELTNSAHLKNILQHLFSLCPSPVVLKQSGRRI